MPRHTKLQDGLAISVSWKMTIVATILAVQQPFLELCSSFADTFDGLGSRTE